MNRINSISLSIFALALLTVSIAQAQPEVKTTPPQLLINPRIDTRDAVKLSLATDQSNYFGGDIVELTLSLKNTGTKPFNILPMDVECFYEIEVTGPDGKVLPYKKPRRSIYKAITDSMGMVQQEAVRPGETKKAVVWLSNLFDMSAVGDYKIKATTIFVLGAGNETMKIKSDQKLVTVAPTRVSTWLYE